MSLRLYIRACLEVIIWAAKAYKKNLNIVFLNHVALLCSSKKQCPESFSPLFRFQSTTSKNTLRTFLLLFCIWNGASLSAQKYAYTQYDELSSDPAFKRINSTVQDKAGYIWIGKENGLYRFDGNTYEHYGEQIKSQNIHKLRAFEDKVFFINDIGIYRIDSTSSTPIITPLIEGSLQEIANQPFFPNDLIVSKDKVIWVSQSNHTIGKYHRDFYKTYPFSSSEMPQHVEIKEDADGNIWALSPIDGLYFYNVVKDEFVKTLDFEGGKTLYFDDQYTLIGGKVLHIYASLGKSPRLFRRMKFKNNEVTVIEKDQNGHFIIGTKNGNLYILPGVNDKLKTIYGANDPYKVEKLNFETIYDIYPAPDSISPNGKLWVCTENGLWLLKEHFFKTIINLPQNNPNGIVIGKNGKIWAAINALYQIGAQKDRFYALQVGDINQIQAITLDKADNLWVSSSSPKPKLRKLSKQSNAVIEQHSFEERGGSIPYLYTDSKDNLWFCQVPSDEPITGIAKITNGTVKYYDQTKGFSSRALVLKESDKNEIYAGGIGEDSYLYRYDNLRDSFINISLPISFPLNNTFEVHDIAIDDIGIVWLATTCGLFRYDSEDITLMQDDALGRSEIRGVTSLPNGKIWAATSTNGLVFYEQNISIVVNETAGLPSTINTYRNLITDTEGRIWAGTGEGLVYSNTSNTNLPLSNPPRIQKILVNREKFDKKTIRFVKIQDDSHLELHYTNLTYPSQGIEYQYRLLSKADRDVMLEKQEWIPNGELNTLTINQPDIGKYFLEIRAKQPGGYKWSLPLEISLHVYKPWYRQKWFLTILITAIAFVLTYYFRLFFQRRINKMQKILNFANKRLKEKEALLNQKIHEFDIQHEVLINAESNINTLELFIKEIPQKATWNDIITAMGKAVDESIDIDAFEISFVKGQEIIHRGYSNQEQGGYTFRSKLFDPLTSLTSWTIANNKEVKINDFDKEHVKYIQRKQAYLFKSLIFIPFTLKNGEHAALCGYSVKANQFDNNDLIMFKVLARFIVLSARQEISKVV